MRQYLDAKRQHRDAIVFFRMGDFYEMFYEDALVAARALDLTLTSRSKDAGGNGIAGTIAYISPKAEFTPRNVQTRAQRIEQVFGVPGVGSLLITSILTRDYSIIQFVALVLAFLVIVVNLLTDLTYALLDPRVSFKA